MESPATQSSPLRRIRRRWRVPPAIMHGPEALEGAGMLDELPGAAGLILWQSIRDVTLWAATAPAERAELFSAGAERNRIATLLSATLDAELEQPLGMITAMVGQPGRVSAERVALACRRIAQWAENHGHLATALAFAQAGALTCPGNAAAGYKVGQLARRRAEYARAETWFRRTIALARQEGDWASYALAFSGLGNLYIQRGSLPKARALHLRALRAATRHSLKGIQGNSYHDLHVIATLTGDAEQAQQYAWSAYEAYKPSHPLMPTLAHDVAYFWMTQGYFAPSLAVFRALVPQRGRVVVLPNIVRAAGGAGRKEEFEAAWAEMAALIDLKERNGDAEDVATALLEMANGAASMGDWSRAERAANRAREIARRRKEAYVEVTADSLLESFANEQRATGERPAPAAGPDLEVQGLADAFIRSLEMQEVTV
jgi:tetratricopeptide (TPR) repeat protein